MGGRLVVDSRPLFAGKAQTAGDGCDRAGELPAACLEGSVVLGEPRCVGVELGLTPCQLARSLLEVGDVRLSLGERRLCRTEPTNA